MILPGTYQNGFAPRDGEPLFPELWRGCVGAWNPGLGPTGTRLYDWSAFKNHGALLNGATLQPSQGRYSLSLDGSNDYCESADNDVLDMPSSSRLTISAWVYRTVNVAAFETVVTKRLSNGTFTNYELSFNNTSTGNSKAFGFYSGTTFTVSTVLVPLATWTHIASVSTASGTIYYANGRAAGTSPNVVGNPNSHPFKIGAVAGSPETQFLSANLDDVIIYNRALSPNEIRLLASRRGIAYEMAPRSWTAEQIAAYRRRTQYSQLVGGGVV